MNTLNVLTHLKENVFYCATCNKEMNLVLLKNYEFEEGIPLKNVPAYQCAKCHEFFFTEEQAKKMEQRTNLLQQHIFAFQRKITISGKSLSLSIPIELADHLHLKQGTAVKILPLAKQGFLVKKL